MLPAFIASEKEKRTFRRRQGICKISYCLFILRNDLRYRVNCIKKREPVNFECAAYPLIRCAYQILRLMREPDIRAIKEMPDANRVVEPTLRRYPLDIKFPGQITCEIVR